MTWVGPRLKWCCTIEGQGKNKADADCQLLCVGAGQLEEDLLLVLLFFQLRTQVKLCWQTSSTGINRVSIKGLTDTALLAWPPCDHFKATALSCSARAEPAIRWCWWESAESKTPVSGCISCCFRSRYKAEPLLGGQHHNRSGLGLVPLRS